VPSKFEKFNRRISEWFEWVGLAGLLVMMVITCVDVIGAKVFKSPILGALDIVQLSQIVAIGFAVSMTLIVGRHIQVEFFFDLLPRRVQAVVNPIILLAVLLFFIVIIWRVCVLAYSFQTSGEYTATAYIPLYPFAYGVALAFIPVCLVLLVDFLKSFKQRADK
jgi:TRAP-type C4-dicarboxylate transport system permease small subunit